MAEILEIHKLEKARKTKSARGHDTVRARRAFEAVEGQGWIHADVFLIHLERSWMGSRRLSGSIRSKALDLGYTLRHRYNGEILFVKVDKDGTRDPKE